MSVPTRRTLRSPFPRNARTRAAVPGDPHALMRTVIDRARFATALRVCHSSESAECSQVDIPIGAGLRLAASSHRRLARARGSDREAVDGEVADEEEAHQGEQRLNRPTGTAKSCSRTTSTTDPCTRSRSVGKGSRMPMLASPTKQTESGSRPPPARAGAACGASTPRAPHGPVRPAALRSVVE
jgi:hypothetical protein